ncbi:hypothetical protein GRI89_17200 [Altererythrobacter salegens]|uniref:Uncharacterized protein n=1 Tax=Croceibacterium salegens TaxID=1737568 RepID=A0A6I4SYX9_9SPHN|nr:hypothetical protein [Croceibacterium salegens]MXO61284.1 hypothetical protein [Croceibacterium salegens]
MSAARTTSVFDRPLRPDLAAFFALECCPASPCSKPPKRPLVGILADLARQGLLG